MFVANVREPGKFLQPLQVLFAQLFDILHSHFWIGTLGCILEATTLGSAVDPEIRSVTEFG